MLISGIAIFAGILCFCVITILLSKFQKSKMQIEERVKGIAYDKPEKQNKRKERRKKTKTKEKQKRELSAKTKKRMEKVEEELYSVGIKMPVETFLMLWISITVVIPILVYLIFHNIFLCLIVAFAIAFIPVMVIQKKKKKRKSDLESQLVDAISVLVNALRAGHSFQMAMNTISRDMEEPISGEFGRVFRETQRGLTLEDSLNQMVERTGSEDLGIMCTAIIIQRQVGGNLSEVLENISETIQERISLRGEIKAKTASGRISGYIVGALPLLILGAISVINPGYVSLLFKEGPGHIMLIVSVVMEVIGFLVIKKVVTVKY